MTAHDAFHPATPLMEALRSRGHAPLLQRPEDATSGAQMAEAIAGLRAEIRALPVELEAGDVVAVREPQATTAFLVPMTAWTLGLCTQFIGARETRASADGLLAQGGARVALAWEGSDGLTALPLKGARNAPRPTGTLLSTSGSGGKPKLVLHALEKHIESARAATAFLALGPEDRILLSLPSWHVGGLSLLFRALVSGAVLCQPPADMPLDAALTRFRPTQISLVATQLRRLLDIPAALEGLRACRAVLLGGGPIPTPLRERAIDLGVPAITSYGATETAALFCASKDPAIVRQTDSAGVALPGRDVAVDADGHISLGGPSLLDGYLEDGVLVSALDAHGRWPSGDLGRLEDGVLYVDGRRDRMFISGGENVQPENIEEALLGLAGVTDAAVVPVPDEEFGFRPVAFVGGTDLSAVTLDAGVRAVLPGFQAPTRYYVFPNDAAGSLKPDLPALTALARDERAAATLTMLGD